MENTLFCFGCLLYVFAFSSFLLLQSVKLPFPESFKSEPGTALQEFILCTMHGPCAIGNIPVEIWIASMLTVTKTILQQYGAVQEYSLCVHFVCVCVYTTYRGVLVLGGVLEIVP